MPSNTQRVRLKNDTTKSNNRLNDKQQRFVQEYVVDLNTTKAAKRAGYAHASAHSQGHDLLKKPNVAKAIQQAQAKLSRKTEINAETVIAEIAKLAFAKVDLTQIKPGEKLSALRDLGQHLNLFKTSVEVDQRTTLLSVNVSSADLESARALVEAHLGKRPAVVEGKAEAEDNKGS
jgi:hypothetical protein